MHIEIWSDVVCPFCYIGKRRFEAALEQFKDKENVTIEWKSYLLNPDLKTNPDISINQYLANHKGISLEQATQMNEYVTNMALQSGLTYHMEKAIVANSFLAHQFIHFAKENGKQNEAEEVLFRSYFTEGKNIDDMQILMQLGEEIGFESIAVKVALSNGNYQSPVHHDLEEARRIGIQGVPFFVFDRKYAVSGAQEIDVFLKTMDQAN